MVAVIWTSAGIAASISLNTRWYGKVILLCKHGYFAAGLMLGPNSDLKLVPEQDTFGSPPWHPSCCSSLIRANSGYEEWNFSLLRFATHPRPIDLCG